MPPVADVLHDPKFSMATVDMDAAMDKQISISELRPGMYVHRLKGSWMDRLLWKSEFLLEHDAEVERIRASGLEKVWIDTARGIDIPSPSFEPVAGMANQAVAPAPTSASPAPPTTADPSQVALRAEVDRARKICFKAKNAVSSMFAEARMGKAVETGKARELVEEIALSVERNASALISLARLKTADDYTFMHSVAVCGLMIALARELGLDEKDVREAGVAGLMHDVGKMAIPLKVLNKPGRLTEDEYALVKQHPVQGHEMLSHSPDIGDVTLDVCLHHHERIDGKGYPHNLDGSRISLFAKMGAICDVYDAITSNRPYKAGWDPADSLQKMASWAKGDYEDYVFQAFVKSVGIYPTGSLLLMASGRLGVVVEQNEKSLLLPRVKLFYSTRSNAYMAPELIDLSRPGCMDSIVGPESAAKWGLKKLDDLWAGKTAS